MSDKGVVKLYVSHDMLGNEVELDVFVGYTVTSRGRPAKTQGDPNNCYPEEAAEFEIDKVAHVGFLGMRWVIDFFDLPMSVCKRAEEMITDEIYEGQPEDDHERDDDIDDREER
jgi:hypothetical protein